MLDLFFTFFFIIPMTFYTSPPIVNLPTSRCVHTSHLSGGIFGSLYGTPIINMPQSAILGMHATKMRAVVVNGQVVARPMMYNKSPLALFLAFTSFCVLF
jgi:hypothetical protein